MGRHSTQGLTDYIAKAAQYQADVLSGAIPACRWVQLACERNRKDLDRQETADFPYRFDPAQAVKICQMAEMLPHIKGPKAFIVGRDDQDRAIWNPIRLEPWQCWYLSTMFGWVHAETGLRRFRVSMLLVPRKNAKSTIAAVVVLYMLTSDGESGAECYSAATTRDQAKVVAEIAWEMAKRSPDFCEYFGVRIGAKTTYTLTVPSTASKFAPLSADANTLDALNISFAVVDELHAHKTRAVWDVLDTATGARLQPLLLITTTAGVELGGICDEKRLYLQRVLDGSVVDEQYFGVEYTIDADDEIQASVTQRKANPNYGVSVSPDDLVRKIQEAQHSKAALDNVFTKHFNVWIRAVSSWMGHDLWQSRKVVGLTWEQLRAFPCWIGVDLGEVRDFSAVVLVFKTGADTYATIPFIYVPTEGIRSSPIAQMSGWVRDGWIIETPGAEADYQRIEDDLVAWHGRLKVQEIDFDRRSARLMIQKIKQRLEPVLGKDRTDQLVVDVPQSADTFDPAMTLTEGLVVGGRLQHDGNAAYAWMISNVVVDRSRDERKYPLKAGGKDSPNKIDGPVATWTALSRSMAWQQSEPEYKIYFAGGRK